MTEPRSRRSRPGEGRADPSGRWDDLRCLEALARHGDVRAAARELQLTASTLYRRIAALEAETGARLLVRGPGPTALTEAAQRLAEATARAGATLREALADLRRRDSTVAGEVSLTTVEGMLPFLTAPLTALAQAHPGLTVHLHLGDQGPSLRRREVDVALGVMDRPPTGAWGRRLFRYGYGVFGTEATARREPLPWIVLGPAHAQTPEGRWEAQHASSVVLRTASRGAILAATCAGLGVALLPRPLAALHPELVELRALRPAAEALGRSVWILVHESHRKLPRVVALTTALTQHLRGLGA